MFTNFRVFRIWIWKCWFLLSTTYLYGWRVTHIGERQVPLPMRQKKNIIGNEYKICTFILRTTVPPVHCHIGSGVVVSTGWLQTNALRLSVDVTCTYPKSCKEDSHMSVF